MSRNMETPTHIHTFQSWMFAIPLARELRKTTEQSLNVKVESLNHKLRKLNTVVDIPKSNRQ